LIISHLYNYKFFFPTHCGSGTLEDRRNPTNREPLLM
jgi:hypothetical protein